MNLLFLHAKDHCQVFYKRISQQFVICVNVWSEVFVTPGCMFACKFLKKCILLERKMRQKFLTLNCTAHFLVVFHCHVFRTFSK